jgi:carbonic anhydrase/acetyltransferase-like protein (isoleucine patch superfamily)
MDYLGEMKIDPTAVICRDATVLGNVELGAHSCVLFGAVVRGDCGGKIVVGENTNIQDLACVHVPMNGETVLGNNVTVGHGAIVHGCTIGEGTLVGMGAIVLDGARVGKNCLIGAGAVVTGTANIPDGSMVMGTPARVVRQLQQRDFNYMQGAVDEYVAIGNNLVEQGIADRGFAANACMRQNHGNA